MVLIKRLATSTDITESPICNACAIAPFLNGSTEIFLVSSAMELVFRNAVPPKDYLDCIGSKIVRVKADGSEQIDIGRIRKIDSLISNTGSSSFKAAVLVTIDNTSAVSDVFNPPANIGQVVLNNLVTIKTDNGDFTGRITNTNSRFQPISAGLNGRPILGFDVNITASLTAQESGAPVINADGDLVGMFVFSTGSSAHCVDGESLIFSSL